MESRNIVFHCVNDDDYAVSLFAHDEPGPGGANHFYTAEMQDEHGNHVATEFNFQKGPIKEVGTNGITNEILLAVVIDRLRAFQAGPYTCAENEYALKAAEESLRWHQERTGRRLATQIEGTSTFDSDAPATDSTMADRPTPGTLHNIPEVQADGITAVDPIENHDNGFLSASVAEVEPEEDDLGDDDSDITYESGVLQR